MILMKVTWYDFFFYKNEIFHMVKMKYDSVGGGGYALGK